MRATFLLKLFSVNTCRHIHVHTHITRVHMHTRRMPPQRFACLPTYTTRRPDPVPQKLFLSPVYFPFPLLFVIVLMWELGRGLGRGCFWVEIP